MAFKLTKKELKQIKDRQKEWFLKGNKLTFYKCNYCEYPIVTIQPNKEKVEKSKCSAMICTECNKTNFVSVYPDGKTESVKLGS